MQVHDVVPAAVHWLLSLLRELRLPRGLNPVRRFRLSLRTLAVCAGRVLQTRYRTQHHACITTRPVMPAASGRGARKPRVHVAIVIQVPAEAA